jgi:putative sigma-54 modulation protein
MKIQIQSLHFTADQKLLDLVEEKVSKLEHFFDGIIGADVILRLEPAGETENKTAEIIMRIPGNDLFAKRKCRTFEEAIDGASDAISVQVRKHKEKVKGL